MIPTSEENSKTVSRSLDITNYDDGYNYTDIIFGIHDQASYIRHSRDVYEENIDEKSLTAYDFLFFVYVGMVFLLIIGSAIMSVKIINVMGEAVKLDYQTNEKRSGNESMDEKEMLDCYRRRNHCRNYNKECNKESNSTNRECSSVNRECNIASKKLPAVPESPKKRYTPKFNGRNSSKGCMTTIPASLNGIDETVNKKNDKRVCVATDKILEEINPSPKEERSTSSTNIHTNAPMTNIHNAAMAQLLDSKHHQKRKEKINKKEVVPFQINNPMPRTNSRGRSGRSVSTPRPRPLNPPPKDTDEIYNSKRTSVLSDTNSEHYHGSYHPQEYYTSSPHPNSLENESELIKSVFSTEFRKSPGFDRYFGE
uniref:Uncharacterized protein n=1 Tax=Corethron hystrix TaxID=216773 RepID=A0A7S1C2H9_9STRA|mmetsp:Transcript_9712/g.21624  ORF Transcript_9712/g.21624 Transcript_9712/m.21624 type:complete len:368 (+) Transcript_9712:303-1406(+)